MIPLPHPVPESTMSRLRTRFPSFTISDLARRDDNIARLFPEHAPAELPAYVPFDPLSLSTLQQAALLMMRISQVKNTLIRTLLEDSQDKPTPPDFAALRELQLAEWQEGKRFNELTGNGRVAADKLEKTLCKQFQIHLLLTNEASRTELQHASCSCGDWHRSFKRGRGTTGEVWRSHGRHVESVTAVSAIYQAMKPPATEAC